MDFFMIQYDLARLFYYNSQNSLKNKNQNTYEKEHININCRCWCCPIFL